MRLCPQKFYLLSANVAPRAQQLFVHELDKLTRESYPHLADRSHIAIFTDPGSTFSFAVVFTADAMYHAEVPLSAVPKMNAKYRNLFIQIPGTDVALCFYPVRHLLSVLNEDFYDFYIRYAPIFTPLSEERNPK